MGKPDGERKRAATEKSGCPEKTAAESGGEKREGPDLTNLSLGMALGAAFGLLFNQLALGIVLGLAAGFFYDRLRTGRNRPSEKQEKNPAPPDKNR